MRRFAAGFWREAVDAVRIRAGGKRVSIGLRSVVPFIATRFGFNLIVDRMVKPISFDELRGVKGADVEYFNVNRSEYEQWIRAYYPEWQNQFGSVLHKKLIEFFTTFALLDPRPDDVFMDAAGAAHSYLPNISCTTKYLQDIRISQYHKTKLGNDIEYLESDAGSIPLPDESIDKISCHHSFEHFQGNSDTLFINEVQRLLKPGGRCSIIHIFIGSRFLEVTDAISFKRKFDGKSRRVIDPTAAIPGGRQCGNYARIYDLGAFQERVMGSIDPDKFKVTISELRLNGDILPDLTLDCHKHVTAINRPYRALTIERRVDPGPGNGP